MDGSTLKKLAEMDRVLGRLIRQVGPMTLKPQLRQSPYEALVESVVYQQLTGKAAATIFSRVLEIFGTKKAPKPELILKTPDSAFRLAGLSGAKTAAIKDIAAKFIEGVVPTSRQIQKLSDEEIVNRLTAIRGVGPWTVEMLLIFKMGRPDVLPSTDYGVRKGFALTYRREELPTPKELLAYGERWRPFRTTAAWYLWRSLDKIAKKKNTP